MTKKIQNTTLEEKKQCVTYIRSIKTQSYEIFKGQKAKLTQTVINEMHEEMKAVCPNISDWVVPTPKGA
jgi:hypothetical protein